MRGALTAEPSEEFRDGIIPAYAGSTNLQSRVVPVIWDHPRVCGEHCHHLQPEYLRLGSSPRMRGAPVLLYESGKVDGIIPAYAGSTPPLAYTNICRWDHPRVCGEHSPRTGSASKRLGSSPRMRGAQRALGKETVHARIIPAYAGSTLYGGVIAVHEEDHPRVCGEHLVTVAIYATLVGSSPRMRGALLPPWPGQRPERIIPAYAGSTSGGTSGSRGTRDHPRVCGEHREVPLELVHLLWIIPAYAGSTVRDQGAQAARRDHPRVCGEHSSPSSSSSCPPGSSPRMRGAHPRDVLLHLHEGIIPAYAGSTTCRRPISPPARDHPRVCGEHGAVWTST